ncbi:hypothetical protein [Micromonospora sp. GCM10011541]|uniref:hypothetical protein n=1 Tax=Micromonospora sp. GCM10011541 TaxID=3317336 RepID=UPI00360BAE74
MSPENYDLPDDCITVELSDLSAEEVEGALVEHWNRATQDQPWYAHYAYSEWSTHKGVEEVEGLGNVEVVEIETGVRCDDDARLVFRVASKGGEVVRHFAVDGVACVEVGPYWGGLLYEVVPEEVLVTRYEPL